MPNLSIQDEIMNRMAEELSREIDFGVMSEMMVQSGWHKVQLDRFKNNNQAIDIKYWAEEHCKFGHFNNGTTYVFEDQGDAVNFTLKWA